VEVREWFADRILPVTEAVAERWGRLGAQQFPTSLILTA